jgi:hypothetical protein
MEIAMANVLNKRIVGEPKGSVYIGRGSIWGNPFVIGKDGTRADVCRKYANLMFERLTGEHGGKWADALENIKGKDLVCWCAPQQCHGDHLLHLANDTNRHGMEAE